MQFQLLFLFLLPFSLCGDGIGDGVTQILKTTVPFLRPQKAGFFFNVHEIENLGRAEDEALTMGLQSQIDSMSGAVGDFTAGAYSEQAEARGELAAARAIGGSMYAGGMDFESSFNGMFKRPSIMGNRGGAAGGAAGGVVVGKQKDDCGCLQLKTGEGQGGVIKKQMQRLEPLKLSRGVDFVDYSRRKGELPNAGVFQQKVKTQG